MNHRVRVKGTKTYRRESIIREIRLVEEKGTKMWYDGKGETQGVKELDTKDTVHQGK